MGKFDKYLGKGKSEQKDGDEKRLGQGQDARPQLPSGNRAGLAARPGAAVAPAAPAASGLAERRAAYAAQGQLVVRSKAGRFAILIDATGSMGWLIETARAEIGNIIGNLAQESGGQAKIVIVVYRDYVDQGPVVEVSAEGSDAAYFVQWLQGIQPKGGGANEGEAMDAGLREVEKLGKFDAIMVAGDEPSLPDPSRYAQGSVEPARVMAQRLGTPIHTFAMGHDPRCLEDFEEIARLSGGQAGKLDGSEAMQHMAVMAMLNAVKGTRAVQDYMTKYAGLLPESATSFGGLLLTAGSKGKKG
jgi:hypothetical protein